jgi:hypothetical protein
MNGVKAKIGAGATLAALGGLAAYAVASGDEPGATQAAKAQPVEVRTETIRRTVRVVKHEKPKHRRQSHRASTAAAPPAPAPAPAPVAAAPAAPAQPASSRVVSAPAPSRNVTTRTSGGSGRGEHEGEHESEHEGGDD